MIPERERFYKELDKVEAAKPSKKGKIVHIFNDVSMRKGHPGLSEMAAKAKINLNDLTVDEYVLFFNRQKTALKMFAAGWNNLNYFKMPERAGVIDMRVISLIPKFFNGNKIEYDKAVKEVLEKTLFKK
jgi:hypothetical protein